MRAARGWSIPPLTMWDGDGKTWTPKDRTLAMALHLHEASLCPDCRQPARIAHDPEYEGFWETATVDCLSCAQSERDSKQAEAEKDTPPGRKRYPVFVGDI